MATEILQGYRTYIAAGTLIAIGLWQIAQTGAFDASSLQSCATGLGLFGLRAAIMEK